MNNAVTLNQIDDKRLLRALQLLAEEENASRSPAASIPFDRLVALRPHTILNHNVPPYLFLPEVRRVIECAETDLDAVFYEFLFVTGARINEALTVQLQDCFLGPDTANRKPHVIIKTLKQTKGKPKRYVPLEPAFAVRLQRYVNTARIKARDRLFPKTARTWQGRIANERAKHGFDIELTPHTFRHSCAVHLNLLGMEIPDIQAWLGHANISNTMIYAKVALELKREIRPEAVFR